MSSTRGSHLRPYNNGSRGRTFQLGRLREFEGVRGGAWQRTVCVVSVR